MKLRKEKVISLLWGVCGVALFGETAVTLPDITTVISSEELSVEKEAIPDYSAVLPENFLPEDALPSVPALEEDMGEEKTNKEFSPTENLDNDIFVQGKITVGWPFCFGSHISLLGTDVTPWGENPFTITFDTAYREGMGEHSAREGFFFNNTQLWGTKEISGKRGKLSLSGGYESFDIGLQGQSSLFDDINRKNIVLGARYLLPLSSGFFLTSDGDFQWVNRYAGVPGNKKTGAEDVPLSDNSLDMSLVNISPGLGVMWSTRNRDKSHNFGISAGVDWDMLLNTENAESQHRLDFELSSFWTWSPLNREQTGTSRFTVSLSGDLVYYPLGTGGTQKKLITPFALTGLWESAGGLWGDKLSFSLSGGLQSCHIDFMELEKKEPFTNFSSEDYLRYGEAAYWFGDFQAYIPVLSYLVLDGTVKFQKTAFGLGELTAIPEKTAEGLFYSQTKDVTRLETAFSLLAYVGDFTLVGGWQGYFIDKPVYKPAQEFLAEATYSDKNGLWGASVSVRELLGTGDGAPIVDTSAYIKPASSLTLKITMEDAIKLFTGKQRIVVKPFVKQGGSVTASVEFVY